MTVAQKIFIVKFVQESRFLFHHTIVATICHPWKASSSYKLHIHTFIMHVPGWKVGPPHKLWCAWLKKDDGSEERCQIEAHYQIKVESIKGEIAGLRFARTSIEHQMERECLHSLRWEHCLSTSNWSCLSFSVMNNNNNAFSHQLMTTLVLVQLHC